MSLTCPTASCLLERRLEVSAKSYQWRKRDAVRIHCEVVRSVEAVAPTNF